MKPTLRNSVAGIAALLTALATTLDPSTAAGIGTSGSKGEIQVAVVCFKRGEQLSGMNKICFYDCLGSAAAITIGSTQLCPLTIEG